MNGVDDPVNARILADGLVLRVNEDDFVVLVGRILVDPVGVENTQVGTSLANTLLSSGSEGSLILELVDTLVGRFAYITPVSHSGASLYNQHSNPYRR